MEKIYLTYFRALPAGRIPVVIVVMIICFVFNASCVSGITKKQKQTLAQHAEIIAEAINATVKYVQRPLMEFQQINGYWPVNDQEQRAFIQQVWGKLRRYPIESMQLAAIDQSEVVVEFFLSNTTRPKLPQLIESWVIVFQVNEPSKLQIVSVYPVWSKPEYLAEQSSLDSLQISQFQQELKRKLHEKLMNFSIKLNENFSQLAG